VRFAADADRAQLRARRGFALCTLALLLFAPSTVHAATPPAAPAVVDYSVAAGDDCRSIAARFFPQLAYQPGLDAFHALNPQLGPQPHHLKPGQVLRVQPLTPDALLTFLKPDVNRRAEREPDWKPATRGDGLFRLDQVNTLRGAGAEITFHDLSAVQLDENALIVIYGEANKPKKHEKSGAIELVQGDASVSLSALRGEKPLEVQTPAATVSVRGDRSRIGVDRQKMSRVSVFKGDASVVGVGKPVAVPSGFGTRVEKGKAPETPTPLPEAPRWNAPVQGLVTAFSSEVPVQLGFDSAARAAKYRVQIARDPGFNDRAFDQVVDAGPVTAKLLPGTYRARVWAIDAKGLDGPPSAEKELQLVSIHASGGAPDANGVLHGKAGTKLTLELQGAPDLPLALDGWQPLPLAQQRSLQIEAPGIHTLSTPAGAFRFEIDPPPAAEPPPPPRPPAPPPPPPPPPPKRAIPEVGETRGPLGSANTTTGGTALPTGFLERGFIAQVRVQPEFGTPTNRDKVFLSALDLEVGTGGLAIFASGTLIPNYLNGNTLGFPTVGIQGRIAGDAELGLTIGGDVSLNLAHDADGLESSRARAWVAGVWRIDRFSLSTTQAITPAQFGTGYEGNLIAGWFFCPGFIVQAELDGDAAGLCPSGGCLAGAASIGVRGRWKILEAGAGIRTGLGVEGRMFWGEPAGIFTLGIHLGGRDVFVSP
jgi:hypothetical protein